MNYSMQLGCAQVSVRHDSAVKEHKSLILRSLRYFSDGTVSVRLDCMYCFIDIQTETMLWYESKPANLFIPSSDTFDSGVLPSSI